MNTDRTAKNWQKAIIADAEEKLGRTLLSHEREFIASRSGFIALEMIHDTIKASRNDEIEAYLGSERQKNGAEQPAREGRGKKPPRASAVTFRPLKRFDCPSCGRPLSFRLLPHVPRPEGRFAFSCVHCGAVLTYSDAHIPLGSTLWGTRLRALLTFVCGIVVLSAAELAGGRAAALAVLAIAAVILGAAFFLSPRPAYRAVNREDAGHAPHQG